MCSCRVVHRDVSPQTAEIGMTENVGNSGLRFEIWFRRRKSQDTFILQASSGDVKAVWTTVIGKILWRQALRNRGERFSRMSRVRNDVIVSRLTPSRFSFRVTNAGDGFYGNWKQAVYGH